LKELISSKGIILGVGRRASGQLSWKQRKATLKCPTLERGVRLNSPNLKTRKTKTKELVTKFSITNPKLCSKNLLIARVHSF